MSPPSPAAPSSTTGTPRPSTASPSVYSTPFSSSGGGGLLASSSSSSSSSAPLSSSLFSPFRIQPYAYPRPPYSDPIRMIRTTSPNIGLGSKPMPLTPNMGMKYQSPELYYYTHPSRKTNGPGYSSTSNNNTNDQTNRSSNNYHTTPYRKESLFYFQSRYEAWKSSPDRGKKIQTLSPSSSSPNDDFSTIIDHNKSSSSNSTQLDRTPQSRTGAGNSNSSSISTKEQDFQSSTSTTIPTSPNMIIKNAKQQQYVMKQDSSTNDEIMKQKDNGTNVIPLQMMMDTTTNTNTSSTGTASLSATSTLGSSSSSIQDNHTTTHTSAAFGQSSFRTTTTKQPLLFTESSYPVGTTHSSDNDNNNGHKVTIHTPESSYANKPTFGQSFGFPVVNFASPFVSTNNTNANTTMTTTTTSTITNNSSFSFASLSAAANANGTSSSWNIQQQPQPITPSFLLSGEPQQFREPIRKDEYGDDSSNDDDNNSISSKSSNSSAAPVVAKSTSHSNTMELFQSIAFCQPSIGPTKSNEKSNIQSVDSLNQNDQIHISPTKEFDKKNESMQNDISPWTNSMATMAMATSQSKTLTTTSIGLISAMNETIVLGQGPIVDPIDSQMSLSNGAIAHSDHDSRKLYSPLSLSHPTSSLLPSTRHVLDELSTPLSNQVALVPTILEALENNSKDPEESSSPCILGNATQTNPSTVHSSIERKLFSTTVSEEATNNFDQLLSTTTGQKAASVFDSFDTDKMGKLPHSAMESLLDLLGEGFHGEEMNTQIALVDRNQCGELHRMAFIQWYVDLVHSSNGCDNDDNDSTDDGYSIDSEELEEERQKALNCFSAIAERDDDGDGCSFILFSDFPRLIEALGTTYCEDEHLTTTQRLQDDKGRIFVDKFLDWYLSWLFRGGDESDEDLQTALGPGVEKPIGADENAGIVVATSRASESNGWGNLFMIPNGNWKCNVCFVQNTKEIERCVSCDTLKHDTNTASHLIDFKKGENFVQGTSSIGSGGFIFQIPNNEPIQSSSPTIPDSGQTIIKTGETVRLDAAGSSTADDPKKREKVVVATSSIGSGGFTFQIPNSSNEPIAESGQTSTKTEETVRHDATGDSKADDGKKREKAVQATSSIGSGGFKLQIPHRSNVLESGQTSIKSESAAFNAHGFVFTPKSTDLGSPKPIVTETSALPTNLPTKSVDPKSVEQGSVTTTEVSLVSGTKDVPFDELLRPEAVNLDHKKDAQHLSKLTDAKIIESAAQNATATFTPNRNDSIALQCAGTPIENKVDEKLSNEVVQAKRILNVSNSQEAQQTRMSHGTESTTPTSRRSSSKVGSIKKLPMTDRPGIQTAKTAPYKDNTKLKSRGHTKVVSSVEKPSDKSTKIAPSTSTTSSKTIPAKLSKKKVQKDHESAEGRAAMLAVDPLLIPLVIQMTNSPGRSQYSSRDDGYWGGISLQSVNPNQCFDSIRKPGPLFQPINNFQEFLRSHFVFDPLLVMIELENTNKTKMDELME